MLELIHSRKTRMGAPPTIREICESLGITSTNGANDHLKALERKGLIDRGPSETARAICLTEAGYREIGVRFCEHCRQPLPTVAA